MRLVDPGAGPDDEIEVYRSASDAASTCSRRSLARDIWEGLAPDEEKLLVAVQGYGRFWIRFVDRARQGL